LDRTVGKDKKARKSKPKPRFLARRRKYNPLDGVVELIASAERYDKSRHGAVDATRVMSHVLDVADKAQLQAIVNAGSRFSDEWKRAASERCALAAVDVPNLDAASVTTAPATVAPAGRVKSADEITAIAIRVRRNTINADLIALCDWVLAAAVDAASRLRLHGGGDPGNPRHFAHIVPP
jgi:hypothetical protein